MQVSESGIRAPFPGEIDAGGARRLGVAIRQRFPGPLLIGKDCRRASAPFARALIAGVSPVPGKFSYIGSVSTPVLAYGAQHLGFTGIQVSASHNADGIVGLKGFHPDGRPIGTEWKEIATVLDPTPGPDPKPRPRRRAGRRGALVVDGMVRGDLLRAYTNYVSSGLHSDLKIVVDTRGGPAALVARTLLERVGCRVVELHPGVSSRFFGLSPEPTAMNVGDLSRRVVREKAAFGAALDGDGDRALFVDATGAPLDPEAVALALHQIFGLEGTPVVTTLDASGKLDELVPTVRSRTGSAAIIREMRRTGARLGFETSSHFYLKEYDYLSDGLLVAALLATGLSQGTDFVSEAQERLGELHRSRLTLTATSAPTRDALYPKVVRSLPGHPKAEVDGYTTSTGSGRVVVRKSNTEPVIRVSIESPRRTQLSRLVESVSKGLSFLGPEAGASLSGPQMPEE